MNVYVNWGMGRTPQYSPPPQDASREGYDVAPVTFMDGPFAGQRHSLAFVKRDVPPKLPGRYP
jgi:hypothetical protein